MLGTFDWVLLAFFSSALFSAELKMSLLKGLFSFSVVLDKNKH